MTTKAQLEAQLADAERHLTSLKFFYDNSSFGMGPQYRQDIANQRQTIHDLEKQIEQVAA